MTRIRFATLNSVNFKVGRFKSEDGPDTLSSGLGISIETSNYTRPGSCIKTALPLATVTSLGPVNWGVVYPTVTTSEALGSESVFLRCPNRT